MQCRRMLRLSHISGDGDVRYKGDWKECIRWEKREIGEWRGGGEGGRLYEACIPSFVELVFASVIFCEGTCPRLWICCSVAE